MEELKLIFETGQIFEKEYPPEAAIWCNENNCYIEELESIDDIRRFEIKVIPQPTEEELKQREIMAIKAELVEIDLKSIRALRAGEIEYVEQYEAQAVALRERLAELEA